MDRLFISPQFVKIAANDSGKNIMIHGVCRPSLGVPKCTQQDALTRKEDLLRIRGTVKVIVLSGDALCKYIVVASFMIQSQCISYKMHVRSLNEYRNIECYGIQNKGRK